MNFLRPQCRGKSRCGTQNSSQRDCCEMTTNVTMRTSSTNSKAMTRFSSSTMCWMTCASTTTATMRSGSAMTVKRCSRRTSDREQLCGCTSIHHHAAVRDCVSSAIAYRVECPARSAGWKPNAPSSASSRRALLRSTKRCCSVTKRTSRPTPPAPHHRQRYVSSPKP